MSILTQTYEVWQPMPNQDLTLPPAQLHWYLSGTFTSQDDALAAGREANGAAVVSVTFPAGVRTVVQRPAPTP
jgi:hypothetical protein